MCVQVEADTDSEELSFESTFERDMLLHFTDLSCHQVRSASTDKWPLTLELLHFDVNRSI